MFFEMVVRIQWHVKFEQIELTVSAGKNATLYFEVLELANISSVSWKRSRNGDSAIAIIEISLKYFTFGF